MDAPQSGQSFTVTRDGHRIGELIPLRRRRRFVPRGEFAAMSRTAPAVSPNAFRADQDAPCTRRGPAGTPRHRHHDPSHVDQPGATARRDGRHRHHRGGTLRRPHHPLRCGSLPHLRPGLRCRRQRCRRQRGPHRRPDRRRHRHRHRHRRKPPPETGGHRTRPAPRRRRRPTRGSVRPSGEDAPGCPEDRWKAPERGRQLPQRSRRTRNAASARSSSPAVPCSETSASAASVAAM